MLAFAAICKYLYSVFILLFSDSDSVCWVKPAFWLCFVVDLVDLLFLMMLYNLAASTAFIIMGINPVKVQKASLDVVRKAFAMFMSMRHCTLLYTVLLHSFSSASIHTGAPYSRSVRIAPLMNYR